MRRTPVTVTLTLALASAALALAGCKQEQTQPAAGSGSTAPKVEPKAAAGGTCTAPTIESIPAGPVKGQASGKPFVVATVYFEPGLGKWRLVLHEGKFDKPTEIGVKGQSINIDLPEPPAAGKKWTRELKYGDGYFQINKKDDPSSSTSWNGTNGWALEITKWDVKPWDPKGSPFQDAGKASGKVSVCYKGSGDFTDSWAAGTFADVAVRYMGQPYYDKKEEKKEEGKAEKKEEAKAEGKAGGDQITYLEHLKGSNKIMCAGMIKARPGVTIDKCLEPMNRASEMNPTNKTTMVLKAKSAECLKHLEGVAPAEVAAKSVEGPCALGALQGK
jgi:hypothetical protein